MEQQVNIPVGASIDRATGKIIPITREGGQDELNALIERLAKAGLYGGLRRRHLRGDRRRRPL